ncbi:MAG: hypothetical protein ACI9F9_003396 [Candidatus Paceibacteria bacterium]|jgi:hypothetical protein
MKNMGRSLRRSRKTGLHTTLFVVLSTSAAANTRWHVDASSPPGQDGLGWSSAFHTTDEALTQAHFGDEIWVKAGRYFPSTLTDSNDPRTASLSIPVGVSFYGGFNGTEATLAQRAGLYDQTILSGDLGLSGDSSDNAYHVVKAVFLGGTPAKPTILDGFTIRDGNANAPGHSGGGGVYMFNAGLLMSNCTLRDNMAVHGAGLHAQPALAYVSWCKFVDNHASGNGGAIWGRAINFKLSHSTLHGNTADKGGALHFSSIFDDSAGHLPVVLVHNSLLHDNSASEGGGASWASSGAPIPSRLSYYNSIVWHNSAPLDPNFAGRNLVYASNIENGVHYGSRNISPPPHFRNGPGRDLRLASNAPSIDSGADALVPPDFLDLNENGVWQEAQAFDLDHNPRFTSELNTPGVPHIVNMGAYEY